MTLHRFQPTHYHLIRTIFFDLDDTLYPNTCGLWEAIGERITQYMVERIGLPAAEVPALRQHYLSTYGTTLIGLMREHRANPDDYLAYVHDIPLDRYLRPIPVLAAMLERLPQVKVVLTNADREHAGRVLTALALQAHFDAVVDIRALNWVNKPEPAAFRRAMQMVGADDPRECLLVEDSIRNLRAAKALGFVTAYVGSHDPGEAADYRMSDLSQLCDVVPGLLDGDV